MDAVACLPNRSAADTVGHDAKLRGKLALEMMRAGTETKLSLPPNAGKDCNRSSAAALSLSSFRMFGSPQQKYTSILCMSGELSGIGFFNCHDSVELSDH